jgi:diketogulonate reductase-like aldo/keto reductase
MGADGENGIAKKMKIIGGFQSVTIMKLLLLAAPVLAGEGLRIQPHVNQVQLHTRLAQPQLMEYCRSKHVLLTAFCPISGSDLEVRRVPIHIMKSVRVSMWLKLSNFLDFDACVFAWQASTLRRIAEQRRVTPAAVVLRCALPRWLVSCLGVKQSYYCMTSFYH